MPLSEHEQRLLEQMEQALSAEDPKFASHMIADPARSRARRRVVVGSLGVVVGLGLVLVGAMSQQIWLAVVGFVVMVGGCAYAFMPARHRLGVVGHDGTIRHDTGRGSRASTAHGAGAPRPMGGFMERLEERWERRRRGQG